MNALSERVRTYLLPAATAIVAAAVFALASRFLIDDTFITLSYARNLAFHGEWALVSGHPSNTATSPLNVLALAAGTIVVRDAVLACGIVFVLSCVATVVAFRRIALHQGFSTGFAPVTLALIVVNPVVSSSLGLEVILGTAILAWVAVFAMEHSPIALGVASGLAVVARVDLVVVAAALVLIRSAPLRRLWLSALAAAATALPWFFVSWVFLGSVVPDTVVIKTGQGAWGEWGFGNGLLMYLDIYPAAAVLTAVVPILGALCLLAVPAVRRWRRATVLWAWALGGVVYYAAYTLLEVPPYHWYYGVPAVAGTVMFVGAMFAAPSVVKSVGLAAAGAAGLAGAALWSWTTATDRVVPITTNHATANQYEDIGAQLPAYAGDKAVRSGGEIGALSYYCECLVVDKFSDRGALEADLRKKTAEPGVAGWLWRKNFHFLDFDALEQVGPIPLDYRLLRVNLVQESPPSFVDWPITSPWTGAGELHLTNPDVSVPN
ncbi:hypothetical protein [Rhodococcoides fascians]|uniref:hypothetical protein n=1 Tax=Rhodococcoides fascians TaxID=1828 RepID=UPI0005665D71|nr:hypothetical protein [Rhodococcus fascians]